MELKTIIINVCIIMESTVWQVQITRETKKTPNTDDNINDLLVGVSRCKYLPTCALISSSLMLTVRLKSPEDDFSLCAACESSVITLSLDAGSMSIFSSPVPWFSGSVSCWFSGLTAVSDSLSVRFTDAAVLADLLSELSRDLDFEGVGGLVFNASKSTTRN